MNLQTLPNPSASSAAPFALQRAGVWAGLQGVAQVAPRSEPVLAGVPHTALASHQAPQNWAPGHLECLVPVFMLGLCQPNQAAEVGSHWGEVLLLTQRLQGCFRQRFAALSRGWTAAHVERVAVVAQALAAHLQLRGSEQGSAAALPPALVTLYTLAGWLRQQAAGLAPDSPLDARSLLMLKPATGAARPSGLSAARLATWLAVLLEAKTAPKTAPGEALQPLLVSFDAAVDYGLLGLQAHATVSSLWPVFARGHEMLVDITRGWAAQGHQDVARLHQRLAHRADRALRAGAEGVRLATEGLRAQRESVLADHYRQCGLGVRDALTPLPLQAQLMPPAMHPHALVERRMESHLLRRFGRADRSGHAEVLHFVACVMDCLQRAQAVLRVAGQVQGEIDHRLGRAAPPQRCSLAMLGSRQRWQGPQALSPLSFIDDLDALLGWRFSVDAQDIELSIHERAGLAA